MLGQSILNNKSVNLIIIIIIIFNLIIIIIIIITGDCGSTVVKVLCYKSEGRWFDSSLCQSIFIDVKSFRSHCGPEVESASN